MKVFNKLCIIIFSLIIMMFVVLNVLAINLNKNDEKRLYRVEINRVIEKIEDEGIDSVDFTTLEYVTNIVKCDSDYYKTDSDYIIKEVDGTLYRFDYVAKSQMNYEIIIIVNVSLGLMTIVILMIMIFIKRKILKPFERLVDVPYQLSKGNLIEPLKEDKSRYFNRFIWGVDLLRENIEEQKLKELELQKEKKTLLLSLSHDIKTPLSAIKLYSKALSKGLYTNPDKQKEIAENIDQNANEIEAFVSEIVTASKEDFLSIDVNMSEFYISNLINEINNYYKEKLKLIQIPLVINDYKNCMIKGDLNRSIEAIQNIIENAIKYGDGKLIEISIEEEDGCILITIKNSGNTLSSNELPHMFESFFRGSNVSNLKGSGLGLYICRELMHKMNGDIFSKIEGNYMIITCVFTKA